MDKVNAGKGQLISSKILFEGGQYRDSVTMSYYAMYSSALALLLKKEISRRNFKTAVCYFVNIFYFVNQVKSSFLAVLIIKSSCFGYSTTLSSLHLTRLV